MDKIFIFLTLFFALLTLISSTQPASASKVPQAYLKFVKTKCKGATYSEVCITTLSPYAAYVQTNSFRLCSVALDEALQGSLNASKTVSLIAKQKGISRYVMAALKDCIYDAKDAIYNLRETVVAMAHLGEPDRQFQWATAKTYASAAITDEESCMDGFKDRKVSPTVWGKIKSTLVSEQRLISNALFLINHLY